MTRIKNLENLEVKTFDIVDKKVEKAETPSFEHKGISPMRKEHPVLADLHAELNQAILDEIGIGGRSRDLKRAYEIKIQGIRQRIAKYKTDFNITNLDYQRWGS